MPMPKAAVCEYGDFQFRKYKIRLALHFASALPADYALFLENINKFQLRRLYSWSS
jgi:hypothetical protein